MSDSSNDRSNSDGTNESDPSYNDEEELSYDSDFPSDEEIREYIDSEIKRSREKNLKAITDNLRTEAERLLGPRPQINDMSPDGSPRQPSSRESAEEINANPAPRPIAPNNNRGPVGSEEEASSEASETTDLLRRQRATSNLTGLQSININKSVIDEIANSASSGEDTTTARPIRLLETPDEEQFDNMSGLQSANNNANSARSGEDTTNTGTAALRVSRFARARKLLGLSSGGSENKTSGTTIANSTGNNADRGDNNEASTRAATMPTLPRGRRTIRPETRELIEDEDSEPETEDTNLIENNTNRMGHNITEEDLVRDLLRGRPTTSEQSDEDLETGTIRNGNQTQSSIISNTNKMGHNQDESTNAGVQNNAVAGEECNATEDQLDDVIDINQINNYNIDPVEVRQISQLKDIPLGNMPKKRSTAISRATRHRVHDVNFVMRDRTSGYTFFVKRRRASYGVPEFNIGQLLHQHRVPNVVTPLQLLKEDGWEYIFFCFDPHSTLDAALEDGLILQRPISAELIFKGVKCFYTFLCAVTPQITLSEAHQVHLWHQDMKGSQLMYIMEGGEIVLKVCDFGISEIHTFQGQRITSGSGGMVDGIKEILKQFRKLLRKMAVPDNNLAKLLEELIAINSHQDCLDRIHKYENGHT